MQNPSRRLFLGGLPPEIQAWDQFILQLQRKTQATVQVLDSEAQQVLVIPTVLADLHQVRQLCHAFEIKLHLWRLSSTIDDEQPRVWLDCSELNQLTPLDDEQQQWFIQPGVRLAQLRQQHIPVSPSLSGDLLVAEWLADGSNHHFAPFTTQHSGLVHASVLMADGTVSSLGAFGVANTKPLNTPELRMLVPQLFELAASDMAHKALTTSTWQGRYRWDIFDSRNPSLNLSHLLLGHEGELGILEWLVVDKSLVQLPPPKQAYAMDTLLSVQVQEIDSAIKHLFDPHFLLSS